MSAILIYRTVSLQYNSETNVGNKQANFHACVGLGRDSILLDSSSSPSSSSPIYYLYSYSASLRERGIEHMCGRKLLILSLGCLGCVGVEQVGSISSFRPLRGWAGPGELIAVEEFGAG